MNRRRILAALGSHTPTARDYVQDGLIAMWDGIENAGWGVHDPNATVWKDLAGNHDVPLASRPYLTIDNDRLIIDDSNGTYNTLTPDTRFIVSFPELSSSIDDYVATHESVISFDYVGSRAFAHMFGGNCGSVISCGAYGADPAFIVACMLSPTQYGIEYLYINRHGIGGLGKKTCLSCSSVSTHRVVMVNNVMANIDERWNGGSLSFSNRLRFFQLEQKKAKSSIYNYRVYNRVLSDDEKSFNYAIDKARFGLP